MLLFIVLAAVVLVGVGAVVAQRARARPGPPPQNEGGLSGLGVTPGASSGPTSDDGAAFSLAAGSLVVTEQIQAGHAAHAQSHALHHGPDPAPDSSPDWGSTDAGSGDAGSGGGNP